MSALSRRREDSRTPAGGPLAAEDARARPATPAQPDAANGDPRSRHTPVPTVIASDVRLLCDSLQIALATDPKIEVVGTAGDIEALLACARRAVRCVVVLDVSMPRALNVARVIAQELPGASIVAVAVDSSVNSVVSCAEAGISGYVPHDATRSAPPRGDLDVRQHLQQRPGHRYADAARRALHRDVGGGLAERALLRHHVGCLSTVAAEPQSHITALRIEDGGPRRDRPERSGRVPLTSTLWDTTVENHQLTPFHHLVLAAYGRTTGAPECGAFPISGLVYLTRATRSAEPLSEVRHR
jgi:CheY-like chemotaxis protein